MEEMREYGRRWAKYRGPHGLHTNSTGRARAREFTSEKDPDRFDKRKAHARKTLEWLRTKATISGYPWYGVTEEANTPPTVVLDPNALPKTRRTVSFSNTVTVVDIDRTSTSFDLVSIDVRSKAVEDLLCEAVDTWQDPKAMTFMRISRSTWHMYQQWLYQGTLEPLLAWRCYIDGDGDDWCRCQPIIDLSAGSYMGEDKLCKMMVELYSRRRYYNGIRPLP